METLWQDLRYGARQLARSPGFTVVAVLTLALGIGANTVMFSVVNGVLLRPSPYHDSDRIVTLWQDNQKLGAREEVSPANFLDWQERSRSFEALALVEPYGLDYAGEGEPESIRASLVSEDFFRVLAVSPFLGRTFSAEEYQAGNTNVAVFSYGLWRRKFGADPGIVGRTLRLDEAPYVVVGVMPPEFQFPSKQEIWAPRVFSERDKQSRGSNYLTSIARLKAGQSLEQAQAEMRAIGAQLEQEYPRTNAGFSVAVLPLTDHLVGEVRPALLVLLAAVGFVLLIACANVANLLIARGTERQGEFAVRAALGAGRWRLIQQTITESALLALMGAAGGILLAFWGIDLIRTLAPADFPRLDKVGLDATVLGFTMGLSILTAVTFGLAPGWFLAAFGGQQSLKEGGRTAAGGTISGVVRRGLVVAQVALALVMLIGAGLLARSFFELLNVELGFQPARVLAMQVFVYGDKYPTNNERLQFLEDTLERLSGLPGVEAAGAASFLPFVEAQIDIDSKFTIAGHPVPSEDEAPTVNVTIVTPDYFRTMQIPLVRGRLLSETDTADGELVLLINEEMARRQWLTGDPVGQEMTLRFGGSKPRRIVGVVGSVRHSGLQGSRVPEVFLPLRQNPFGSMTLLVRTAKTPEALLPALKAQVWAADKDMAIWSVASMDQLISDSVAGRRFQLLLFGVFAALALVLATVGIYGVISLLTAQRTHEIGVRMALGAQPGEILGLVLRQGMKLTLLGLALGAASSVALTRFLASFLFGITATDPLAFAAAALVLAAVALLACWVPARRAARVDPMVALRYE